MPREEYRLRILVPPCKAERARFRAVKTSPQNSLRIQIDAKLKHSYLIVKVEQSRLFC
ncbi:hypothetical protein Syun_015308 [Stephania yunnanensis]|uniref:Uncharacterized protein n=1 Tax=Stephania yunnanensis TaxID=152371 RepID=A0AAP0JMM9_9MAGN